MKIFRQYAGHHINIAKVSFIGNLASNYSHDSDDYIYFDLICDSQLIRVEIRNRTKQKEDYLKLIRDVEEIL